MAGDVGKAISIRPGYCGYIPSCELPVIPVHPSTVRRLPLSERHQASQALGDSLEFTSEKLSSSSASVVMSGTAPEDIFHIKKRVPNGGTIYSSTMQPPHSGAYSPHCGKGVIPESLRSSAPENKEFISTSSHRTAYNVLQTQPVDEKFYTKLNMERADAFKQVDSVSAGDTRKEIKKKEQVGSGLACIRTASGIPVKETVMVPKMAFKGVERRMLSGPNFLSGTEMMKFSRSGDTLSSSYTRDYGVRGSNPREKYPSDHMGISKASTTFELFSGSNKAFDRKVPGYMGHVPMSLRNVNAMYGEFDPQVTHNKDSLMTTTRNALPGYQGHCPSSDTKGTPLMPELELTTNGCFQKFVLDDVTQRAMNTREHAKSHAIKAFFSAGPGEDSAKVVDQYYQHFRPLEGHMKHGSSSEQRWISDAALHRSQLDA